MDIGFSKQVTAAQTKIAQSLSMESFQSLVKPDRVIPKYGPSAGQCVIFQVTPTPRVEITSYSVPPCLISTLTSTAVSSMLLATGSTNSRWLDLYGNDGAEEQPQEENDTQQPPVPEAPTESPPSASIPAEQASSKLSSIETIQPNGMTPQVPSSNGALSSQYIQQQAPQKIPTYEEPQPSEYREPQQVRSDGVYQNIPVNERSVRPSEMKDEG